ncbi:hypothetical protein [Streptomyces sp. NPDC057363]|uniref:hypothetical protein n=1 Tax=Streptomyces sp. NPDC057363 TaxID=3346107 RepID=UPI00363B8F26
MHEDDQDQEPGPRLRDAAQPNRAQEGRSWRQEALWELDDLADLYPDLPGVRL